ncbi:hypothetical protein [Fusibacter bizertensis]
MAFIFQISAYDREELKEQLTLALDKRTELISRKLLPRLWTFIDWLNRRGKSVSHRSHHKTIRFKIYGVVLLAMGIFLLVPGLVSPKELIAPLLAGALSVSLGIVYLLPNRKKADKKINKKINKKFEKSAIKILDRLQSLDSHGGDSLEVHFNEEGMVMGKDSVTYPNFDIIIETEKLYLITLKTKLVVLQKKDLIVGTTEDFIHFLDTHISVKSEFAA